MARWTMMGLASLVLVACGVQFEGFGPGATTGAGGQGGNSSAGGSNTGGGSTGGGSAGGGGAAPSDCRAVKFDAIDDYVRVPDHEALDNFGPITIEAWIMPESYPSEVQILSHHNHNDSTGYVLLIFSDAKMQFRYQYGGQNHPSGFDDVPANQWHHVAATFDGTTVRNFVDGELVHESMLDGNMADDYAGPLTIGRTSENAGFHFDGIIEELRLSNVARYMASFSLPTEPFEVDDSTVALWHFDGNGQEISDAAGVHHGTLGETDQPEASDPERVNVPCIDELAAMAQ